MTPRGRFRLIESERSSESGPDRPAFKRIRDAFARGDGPGLFHLGAVEATSVLPPVPAYWRDFARLFMTALCAVPDLEERRSKLQIPIPTDALTRLTEAAPPMSGGEYLSVDTLRALWSEMESACSVEMDAFTGTVREFLQRKNPVWHSVGRVHFYLAEQKSNDAAPFAFLATYTARLGQHNKAQHYPLGGPFNSTPAHGTSRPCLHFSSPFMEPRTAASFCGSLSIRAVCSIPWAGPRPRRIGS